MSQPVQNLHNRVNLVLSKNAVRYIRRTLFVQAMAASGDIGQGLLGVVALDNTQWIMKREQEWQEFLDTINTAYETVGCADPNCTLERHEPVSF